MQATQPLRTYQPVKVGIAAFVATALLIAVIVIAALLPSLGRSTGAGSDAGSRFVPVRAEAYDSPLDYGASSGFVHTRDVLDEAPIAPALKLDPDARDGGPGIGANVPK